MRPISCMFRHASVPAGRFACAPAAAALVAAILSHGSPALSYDSTEPPAEALEHAVICEGGAAVGMILPWPAAQTPSDPGWLECDGSPFDTDAYPELAAVLGSGALPDYRGRFLRGAGEQEAGLDDGASVLVASGELGAVQEGTLGAHAHPLSAATPAGTTGSGLAAAGTLSAQVEETVSETVTVQADTSGVTTRSLGRSYDEEANYPYTLFADWLAAWCDSICDCYCLGTGPDWCGDPGRWLHADLETWEETDGRPDGYADWAKLARASFYLLVDSSTVAAGYVVYCRPHETTVTVTSTVTRAVDEDVTVTIPTLEAGVALPGGEGGMETEAAGSGEAVLPAHAPVRWFIRAR